MPKKLWCAKLSAVTKPSPLYRLLEEKLGRPLADVIAERRGTDSWPDIAAYLAQTTGVNVTSESLRNWFRDRITVEVKVS